MSTRLAGSSGNTRYCKLDATQHEVEVAARSAGAGAFISTLESGYETEVGEDGNRLSLGQKQLISFDRAILKQPQLLAMVEATSSVDTETERQIQNGLVRLCEGVPAS
jgi:ATP-binding cassette subfamily B protein